MIAVGALSVLLLAGCSDGGSTSSSSAEGNGAAGSGAGGVSGVDARGGTAPAGGTPAKEGAGSSSLQDQSVAGARKSVAGYSTTGIPVVDVGTKLARTASLDLRVRTIALGLQALVLGEQIGKGGGGGPIPLEDNDNTSNDSNGSNGTDSKGDSRAYGGFGTLTLSVPSDRLDTALDQLGKIGTVLARNTSSQDVTNQYVDTQSRLKTMTASVERVRALMSQAKDLGQVVTLEGEVSRREADLEALQSQLDALKTSVERSTLTVSLNTSSAASEPVTNDGFVAGLRSGWNAFTTSAAGLLTATGAVLPFAIFLALVGGPIWWTLRRRLASRPPITPAPAAPTA